MSLAYIDAEVGPLEDQAGRSLSGVVPVELPAVSVPVHRVDALAPGQHHVTGERHVLPHRHVTRNLGPQQPDTGATCPRENKVITS